MATEVTIDDLVAIVSERGAKSRSITAIAGPPGAGKSTVADALVGRLNAAEPGSAAVLPMDGYHFDDAVLEPRGWRPRKGAPHTFDVSGFAHMLARLRANDEAEVAVPVFDRSLECGRNAGRIIPASVRHLVVEGNYLLLDSDGWRDLVRYFDTTVFLKVPTAELRARLEDRWNWMSPDERAAKVNGNDMPNAELVQSASMPAEFVMANG